MSSSWADSVAAADYAAKTKPAYVPPHLRNRPPSADSPAPAYAGNKTLIVFSVTSYQITMLAGEARRSRERK
uniref:Uncharacterized protein n=1 Tax=Kalanchoe fedtschenkoi TaxID=63787 RepID=A0A7N0VM91_KALFE